MFTWITTILVQIHFGSYIAKKYLLVGPADPLQKPAKSSNKS